MITTLNSIVMHHINHTLFDPITHHKIIKPPSNISSSRATAVSPISVSVFFVRVKHSKSVHQLAFFHHFVEFVNFCLGIARRLVVIRLWICELDFRASYVQVATVDDRLFRV